MKSEELMMKNSPRRMRDSGVEWLGVVPEEWSVRRGKTFLKLLNRGVRDDDEIITCFRDGEVTLRKNRREDGFTVALKECGYQGIEPGDLVVHGMDGFAGSIGISDSRGKASPVLNVLDCDECKRYVMYYLRTMAMKDVFLALSTGIRVRSCDLRWNKLGDIQYILPPLVEQRAIAAYLDERCAKIDAMVADAKKLIEEYKAWKSSLIFEAVTGKVGVDGRCSCRKMHDSGVEWVGAVPEGWRVIRLKYLLKTSLQYGASESGIPFDMALPRYIRITDITLDGKLKEDGRLSLTEETASDYILNDCDILLARSGATVGKAFLYRSQFGRSAFAGYLIRASVDSFKANPLFVHYTMQGVGYENWKSSMAVSATIQNIGADKYNEYQLPVPPLPEQRAVAAYLDRKCSAIDRVVAEKEGLIADLEQYKKSLIFECVTGKREVA